MGVPMSPRKKPKQNQKKTSQLLRNGRINRDVQADDRRESKSAEELELEGKRLLGLGY